MSHFTWDLRKRQANLEKHGLDFEDVTSFDWESAVIRPARASRFGGHRLKAVGWLNGELVAVIFAPLGAEAISIISFRPAGHNERKWLE